MSVTQSNDLVKAVIAEATRLQEFLTELDEPIWKADSTSDGWTIEDVVAHLAGSAAGRANNMARAIAGDSGPPKGPSFLPHGVRASHPSGPLARKSRQKSVPQLLDDFIAGHKHLRRVLETLTVEDSERPCFHKRGVQQVKLYLGIQLQELALHGWDIRWGLDSKAELWSGSLAALVELVPRWIGIAFAPGLDLPAPVRYRFEVSNPVTVYEDLVITGDTYRAEITTTKTQMLRFKATQATTSSWCSEDYKWNVQLRWKIISRGVYGTSKRIQRLVKRILNEAFWQQLKGRADRVVL